MRATGIVRRIDDLGRVVIPKEVRRSLHIKEGEPMEVFMLDDMVCFKKYYEHDIDPEDAALLEFIINREFKAEPESDTKDSLERILEYIRNIVVPDSKLLT